MPFAFWHVACDGHVVQWQIDNPGFWRVLFAYQVSLALLQVLLQSPSYTLLS